MTDGIGVDIAVMAIAMGELVVTGPFDLPMPTDMATGMGPGITAPQASMFKLDFELSDHLVMGSSFLMNPSKSFIQLP